MLSEEQHVIRRKGVCASEISALLGLSPFSTPLDVYLYKEENYRQPENEDMQRGTYLEDGLLQWYEHRESVEVEWSDTLVNGLAIATPDALARVQSKLRVVEVKCPRRAVGWESGPPEGYVLQTQWTHGVVSAHFGQVDSTMHIVALLDGVLRVFPLEADLELQAEMRTFAEHWWKKHIIGKSPPPLGGDESARAWLTRRFPKDANPVRPATPWEDLVMLGLKEAEANEKIAAGAADLLRNQLRESIGEASGIESPAGRVTWRADRNGKRSFRTNWSSPNE